MLTPIQKLFKDFVKEEFNGDVIEVSKEESDTFESIFGTSFVFNVEDVELPDGKFIIANIYTGCKIPIKFNHKKPSLDNIYDCMQLEAA